jgi:hypothetical protein
MADYHRFLSVVVTLYVLDIGKNCIAWDYQLDLKVDQFFCFPSSRLDIAFGIYTHRAFRVYNCIKTSIGESNPPIAYLRLLGK